MNIATNTWKVLYHYGVIVLSKNQIASIKQRPLDYLLLGSFWLILALLPFHALLTNWASANFGSELLIKSWPTILLLMLVPFAAIVLKRDRVLTRHIFFHSRINQLILAYLVLHFVMIAWRRPDVEAVVAALAFNLRFLAMFVLAEILTLRFGVKTIRKRTLKLVLIGGALVAFFGVLQITVLPRDFLTHFGYGFEAGQVTPYLTIDENTNYIRINSTLRGPNPLGAYMALFMLLGIGWLLSLKTGRKRWQYAVVAVAAGVTMWASYSRSAWLGFGLGLGILVLSWGLADERYKKWLLALMGVGLILAPVSYLVAKESSFYQHVVLHDNLNDQRPLSSNSERLRAYSRNIELVKENPFGAGPGTAGPASYYNSKPSRISENYYIQIAQEVGLIGLALFVAINVLVGWRLWLGRQDPVQLALFASLISISVVSLFLHGWQDETLAMTWWGLAGLYFFETRSGNKSKKRRKLLKF